jgi:hypothetical protein
MDNENAMAGYDGQWQAFWPRVANCRKVFPAKVLLVVVCLFSSTGQSI